jgi:hypothetical protein
MVHPLRTMQDEILKAVSSGVYSVPIFMSAAIPDICAALESDDGRTSATRYQAWFDKWAASRMSLMTAEDCYSLRCGLIHQGKLGGLKGGISQVVFPLPNPAFSTLANCRFGDVYMYDISSFCSDMISSSDDWWQASKDNSTVLENAKHVLKVHPTGWGNAISGIPVLA